MCLKFLKSYKMDRIAQWQNFNKYFLSFSYVLGLEIWKYLTLFEKLFLSWFPSHEKAIPKHKVSLLGPLRMQGLY